MYAKSVAIFDKFKKLKKNELKTHQKHAFLKTKIKPLFWPIYDGFFSAMFGIY